MDLSRPSPDLLIWTNSVPIFLKLDQLAIAPRLPACFPHKTILPPMKTHPAASLILAPAFLLVAGSLLVTPSPTRAGEQLTFKPKEIACPVPPANVSDWQFSMGMPGWVPQVAGNLGVDYKTVHTQINPDTIIKDLDMTASFTGEIRKGKFGLYGDFLYLSMSENQRVGGMVSQVNVRLDYYLADLELNYRLIQRPWGWVDVRAGCRYTSLYTQMGFIRSDAAINHGSREFVDNISSTIGKKLESVLSGDEPNLPLPPLSADQKEKLKALIQIAREDPELVAAIKSGVKSEINKEKKRVANELAARLRKSLDFSTTLFEQWWDPYIGLAARINLPKSFYLTARGDYGGFGVGSDRTWQTLVGFGCNITKNTYAELGWRYLYADYEHDGFIYDVSTQGAQFTVGFNF
jgi:hypothetical protein